MLAVADLNQSSWVGLSIQLISIKIYLHANTHDCPVFLSCLNFKCNMSSIVFPLTKLLPSTNTNSGPILALHCIYIKTGKKKKTVWETANFSLQINQVVKITQISILYTAIVYFGRSSSSLKVCSSLFKSSGSWFPQDCK